MNITRALKVAAVAVVLIGIPMAGIATIPEQDYPGLHTGVSTAETQKSEGDSNPWPSPTVTRYLPAPTSTNKSDSASDSKKKVVYVPGPTVTEYVRVPGPTRKVYVKVPGPVHTKIVHDPAPTVTVTPTPSSTE
jgi:hypothetical protein